LWLGFSRITYATRLSPWMILKGNESSVLFSRSVWFLLPRSAKITFCSVLFGYASALLASFAYTRDFNLASITPLFPSKRSAANILVGSFSVLNSLAMRRPKRNTE
jgi:hypothetical protein